MPAIVVALLGVLLLAAPARAQQLSRADSADVLIGTAERLRAQGSVELAESLARMVQRRYADTPASARAAALLALESERRESRAGRVGVIAYTTIYGAWLGVAVPAMLDADDPTAYGIGLLTAAPAGFFAGRAYTRGRSVTAGDAGVIAWGGLWGTWQGVGWDEATDLFGTDCERITVDVVVCDDDASNTFAALVIGGLVGTGTAMFAADRADIPGGTATMVAWGSLWGTWGGFVAGFIADDEDGDDVLIPTLLGGDVGLVAMAVLAPRWDMSTGRAWLVNAAGVMGGAIGGGIDLLTQPDDDELAIMIPTVGAAIGLGLGAHLTRNYDEGRVREGMLDPADASGALVRLRDGDWRVAMPRPAPALLREHAHDEAELGVRIDFLDARF